MHVDSVGGIHESKIPNFRKGDFFSPTHKRTEGRAPVWGSELTSKDAALQWGDPAETAARLYVKLRVLVTDCAVASDRHLAQSFGGLKFLLNALGEV